MLNRLRTLTYAASAASLLALTSPSVVLADTSSTLFEQALYAEETEGDLDKAIQIYKQIIDESSKSRVDVASAMYRLAVCYDIKGNTQASTELLNRLITDMADQQKVAEDAKALLQQLKLGEIKFLPTPWIDGEELTYSLSLPTGNRVGSATMYHSKQNFNGNDAWLLEYVIEGGGKVHMSSAFLDESMIPVFSSIRSPQLGRSKAVFDEALITTTFYKKEGEEKKEVAVDGVVFDVAQATSLIRRLPLQEGFQMSTRVYQSIANMMLDADISVQGIESIDVLGETTQAFKVKAIFTANGVAIQTMIMHIENNERRQVLRTDDGSLISELETVSNLGSGPNLKREYDDLGISFTAEQSKIISDTTFRDPSRALHVALYDPGFKNRITVSVITPEVDDNGDSMRIPENKKTAHLNKFKKQAKRSGRTVEVIEGIPESFLIGSQSTANFSVKATDKNGSIVYTSIYAAKDDTLFYFTLRVKYEDFESELEKFQSFLQNVELL